MKALFGMLIALIFTVLPAKASLSGGMMQTQEYTYDFAVDGGAVGTIDISKKFNLPVGAIVVSGMYQVMTAFTSGGSATVSIGNLTSSAKYLALTAYNNAAYTALTPAALAIGVPNRVAVSNDGKVSISIAVAALTAGKMKVILQVYVPKS